jgi:DNA-binding MarR family transcriptional regulator
LLWSKRLKILFENEPYFRLIHLIDNIHLKARKFAETRLKTINMTYPQLGMLMSLNSHDDISQAELADELNVDTTTVMVLCDSLEKRGWIRRVPDPGDRRVNRILLTEAGHQAHRQALELIQDGFDYMLSVTPVEKINKAVPFLEELHDNLTTLSKRTGQQGNTEL